MPWQVEVSVPPAARKLGVRGSGYKIGIFQAYPERRSTHAVRYFTLAPSLRTRTLFLTSSSKQEYRETTSFPGIILRVGALRAAVTTSCPTSGPIINGAARRSCVLLNSLGDAGKSGPRCFVTSAVFDCQTCLVHPCSPRRLRWILMARDGSCESTDNDCSPFRCARAPAVGGKLTLWILVDEVFASSDFACSDKL